jgi:gamma-glutamyltranspeptidase/glutathione hydrolase
MLHNRGGLFVLTEGHPNQIAPGKRPYHTLSPLLALRDGRFAFTLGTPGGDGQTQTLIKVVSDFLLFGLTPQEALEAPRFRTGAGLALSIEEHVSPAVRAEGARTPAARDRGVDRHVRRCSDDLLGPADAHAGRGGRSAPRSLRAGVLRR